MRQYFGDPDDCAMRKDYDDAMYGAKLPVCAECNETITDEYVDYHGERKTPAFRHGDISDWF